MSFLRLIKLFGWEARVRDAERRLPDHRELGQDVRYATVRVRASVEEDDDALSAVD